MEPPQQGEPREEPSAGKKNPVQEPTNGQADVWVLLPGTSGDPHPADDAPDEVGAEPMIPAAAEDAKPGDPSPDFFKRVMERRRLERERRKSKASE